MGRKILAIVHVDEYVAAEHAINVYASIFMKPTDTIHILFVSSPSIELGVSDTKITEPDDVTHKLFPRLLALLESGGSTGLNKKNALTGKSISHHVIKGATSFAGSKNSAIDAYLSSYEVGYDLMLLVKNDGGSASLVERTKSGNKLIRTLSKGLSGKHGDKENGKDKDKEKEKEEARQSAGPKTFRGFGGGGIGSISHHMIHEYNFPALVVPSSFKVQTGLDSTCSDDHEGDISSKQDEFIKPKRTSSFTRMVDGNFRRRVLILVDESANTEAAVRWFAASTLDPENDTVEMIHVVEVPDSDITGAITTIRTAQDVSLFSKLASYLAERELPEDRLVSHSLTCVAGSRGALTSTIRHYAEAKDFDLIVMSSHGMSALRQKLKGLGGVSDFVLNHISCNAIVVPYPAAYAD